MKELVEQMARLSEDDTEDNRQWREIAASESGTRIRELDESDLIACVDDEFLCSEADHRQEVSNGTDRVRYGSTCPISRCASYWLPVDSEHSCGAPAVSDCGGERAGSHAPA